MPQTRYYSLPLLSDVPPSSMTGKDLRKMILGEGADSLSTKVDVVLHDIAGRIPAKVSELENDSGFLTADTAQDSIESARIPFQMDEDISVDITDDAVRASLSSIGTRGGFYAYKVSDEPISGDLATIETTRGTFENVEASHKDYVGNVKDGIKVFRTIGNIASDWVISCDAERASFVVRVWIGTEAGFGTGMSDEYTFTRGVWFLYRKGFDAYLTSAAVGIRFSPVPYDARKHPDVIAEVTSHKTETVDEHSTEREYPSAAAVYRATEGVRRYADALCLSLEAKANKVQSIGEASGAEQYPSALAVLRLAQAIREDIPRKVSDLFDDVGILTEHQDISALVTREKMALALERYAEKEMLASYVTRAELLGYDFAKKRDLPDVASLIRMIDAQQRQIEELTARVEALARRVESLSAGEDTSAYVEGEMLVCGGSVEEETLSVSASAEGETLSFGGTTGATITEENETMEAPGAVVSETLEMAGGVSGEILEVT